LADSNLRPAGSLRLLVAEDEPHTRRILTTLLDSAGFQVTAESTGSGALTRIRSDERFDLVLLDLVLPDVGGLHVLEEIRRLPHRKSVPVVILTAKGQDVDREEAFSLGADDFFTKPFSPKKLISRLDQLLTRT
jgi:DNA-binding response OmpR family regulator